MKILDIQHELLYDRDCINIQIDIKDRARINEYLANLNFEKGKEYDITIERHRGMKTSNQNNYYWSLIGQIASVLGASKTEIHNQQLGKYGVLKTDKDNKVLYSLHKASIDFLQDEQLHLKPTGKTEDRNGILYAWFFELKPVHEMNTKEMSDLISGTIQDARDLGINIDDE